MSHTLLMGGTKKVRRKGRRKRGGRANDGRMKGEERAPFSKGAKF